jgi:hypothetical protein
MSTHRAIAAVSQYLRDEIEKTVTGEHGDPPQHKWVTVGPPDKARGQRQDPQLNLFLYQVSPNAAWRNTDPPGRNAGEVAPPLLALRLGYLLTAFGRVDDDVPNDLDAHVLLASAMRRLQEWPNLPRDLPGLQQDDAPESQPERPRVTFQPLTPDEMAKVWAGLQSPYRLSVAYEVGPVLIDSTRPVRAAPPVLSRGESPPNPGGPGGADDPGFRAGPTAPPAAIRRLVFPPGQAGVRPGDTLAVEGDGLDRVTDLEFVHAVLGTRHLLTPTYDRAAKRLTVEIPEDWPAGVWSAALVRHTDTNDRDRREFTSAPAPVPLLPGILLAEGDNGVQRPALVRVVDEHGTFLGVEVALMLKPGPEVVESTDDHPVKRLAQAVTLFAGPRELPLVAGPGDAGAVAFALYDPAAAERLLGELGAAAADTLFVRVRVDGADSSLLKLPYDPATDRREYDPNLVLEVPQ